MDIREWKGSTAKLYLALLFSPGHGGTQAVLMERMGTTDKATFLAARRYLVEVGIAYREGTLTGLMVSAIPTSQEEKPTFIVANPTANMTATVGIPTTTEVSDSPRSRCCQADRAGHRTEQLEALAFAFGERFPGKNVPSKEGLKRLLQLAGDSAEAVDEVFESASIRGPESPFSYVRAILERQKAPVAPPAVIADDLPPAPPEMVAEWKRGEERMKRLGLLPSEEDL